MSETEGVTRLTRLLPIACLVAAICVFASELMTMFEFTPPGGEPLCSQSASASHGNAMFVISVFAIGALAVAVFAGSKPAAVAVAVMGCAALLFFLLGDLPDAGQVGTVNDSCGPLGQSFFDAKAEPQAGFWMLLVSSLALTITGIALATLPPEELAALAPRWWRERRGAEHETAAQDEAVTGSVNAHDSGASPPGARRPRRPRTRQRG